MFDVVMAIIEKDGQYLLQHRDGRGDRAVDAVGRAGNGAFFAERVRRSGSGTDSQANS